MGILSRATAGIAVHLLTASGAALGLLALDATASGRIRRALALMFVAVLIDGIDGTLARRVRIKESVPWVDGELLDNLVDYLNYTIVPAFLIHRTDLLPSSLSLVAVVSIGIASVFQFVHRDAKSAERGFRGFPSYWNVVAFYLLLGGLSRWVNLTIVGVLVVLSFAPIYWSYPSRASRRRSVMLGGAVIWGALLALMLALYPTIPPWLVLLSLVYPALYGLLGSRAGARDRT
jgi:phosphatidylcholine synthase